MKKQFDIFNAFLTTPQKDTQRSSQWYNSSRSYMSTDKHRNPIFKNTSFNTTGKKQTKMIESLFNPSKQHFQFNQVVSDDFCGCETTLSTCKRIIKSYFQNISLTELKSCYQNHPKPVNGFNLSTKKTFLNQLPVQYPQLYHAHLSNLLDHFEPSKFSSQCFFLLAWIHFHCKFQHVTFFFYMDFKDSIKESAQFYHQLQFSLLRQNLVYNEQIRYFQSLSLSIRSFLNDFYESGGTNLIPLSQYARFLQIVKKRGGKALVDLIGLFIVKKKQQFYQILKFWGQGQIPDLRNYSRLLNWDLFFDQIK